MLIRPYLRASTQDQDAGRAKASLAEFIDKRGGTVGAWYTENRSGRSTDRPELRRLLDDSGKGDVLLVESVDRLTRLPAEEWKSLRHEIEDKGLRVVALDLPSTHAVLDADASGDDLTGRIMEAMNSMLLEICAAQAAADYEMRRRRQAEGIAKARADDRYKGRPIDHKLHERILALREGGHSIRETARLAGCSPTTVQRALKQQVKPPETDLVAEIKAQGERAIRTEADLLARFRSRTEKTKQRNKA